MLVSCVVGEQGVCNGSRCRLPIANGGQVLSEPSPHLIPTFELQSDIAARAERYGVHYGLAQVTLRGFAGPTNHWDHSQDTMTLSAGLGTSPVHADHRLGRHPDAPSGDGRTDVH